jgi:O-antigen ligase
MDLLLLISLPVIYGIGLRRPDRLFLLWLALSPLSKDTLVPFGLDLRFVSFDRLALLASVAVLTSRGELQDLFHIPFSRLEKSLFWFLLVFLLEAALLFPPRDALSMWTRALDCFAVPLFLYLFAKHLLTRHDVSGSEFETRLFKTLLFIALYCAVMGVFEALTNIDLFPSRRREWETMLGRPRVNGPFGPPEVLGEYLSLALLLAFYRWNTGAWLGSSSRFLKRISVLSYSALLLLGLFFTMFRNVWGGFLGGYLSRYALSPKGRGKFLMAFSVVALLFFVYWEAFETSDLYSERLSNVNNIYDRLGAWRYSLRAFSEHPLMGIGYGQIKRYIYAAQERGDDLRVMNVPATFHPHNTLIAMLAENGILLAIPLLLILWYFLAHVRACVRLAISKEDKEFGLFAVGGAIAMIAPHMSDRCLTWDKYNILLLLFFAIIGVRHAVLERPSCSSTIDTIDFPLTVCEESSEVIKR